MKTNLLILLTAGCVAFVGAQLFAETLDVGSNRELFVDYYLIDQLDGAELALGQPHDEGVVFRFDKSWEGQYSGYAVVVKVAADDYRLYYRGAPRLIEEHKLEQRTCVALSKDSIHWKRPSLGLYEVHGTKDNNVILSEDDKLFTHNFAPFLDKSGTPQSERFKAVAGERFTGLVIFSSADGFHWKKMFGGEAVLQNGFLDSLNTVFWSEAEQRYVCYARIWIPTWGGNRWIVRATSDDLEHWTSFEEVQIVHDGKQIVRDAEGVPKEHFYTNGTRPYFRAPHIYISTPGQFTEGRVLTNDQIATLKFEDNDLEPPSVRARDYSGARSGDGLMSSRGGNTFQRTFMEDFIRPSIGPENWICRHDGTAPGVHQTGPAEMSIYSDIHWGQPSRALRRYSLRLDGFASLRAPFAGGQMVTKPFSFDGNKLSINYATSSRGTIKMQFETPDGEPIEGFTFINCQEIVGNEIERHVVFYDYSRPYRAGGRRTPEPFRNNLGELAGKPVRLRVVMKDADLYSLQFQK